jgi:3-phosphoshikimate 1-carboxyvinyltransferase
MRIEFEGELVSLPYLAMTRRVIESFGGRCEADGDRVWRIAPTGYTGREYAIEPDASAASYFVAAAAITGGSVRIDGLSRGSMQGDVGFCDALERMGCTVAWQEPAAGEEGSVTVSGRAARGIDIDMNAISDTVPTLAVTALFAAGPTSIRNVAHIRDKETDRIGDLVRELRKLGAEVHEHEDGLTIVPGRLQGASLATYDDHRMAMSLALAGLLVPGVLIRLQRLACSSTSAACSRSLSTAASRAPRSWLAATGRPRAGSAATKPPPQCWQYTWRPSSRTPIRSVRPQTGHGWW